MADTPLPWQILQAMQVRLQLISTANGYRTDAGADVRLEKSSLDPGTRITLFSGATVRPDDARAAGEREFTVIAEAQVPADFDDAHAQIVAIAEDIEEALDTWLPLPSALPLRFQESLFLERPDGMETQAAQLMFSTRFRR